ncbi:MAG: thioether cross-link-forming SCIFF peptide maturase [Eubacteriales bacterium]
MVHKFTKLGNNIAVDTASGSVHVLDDTSYRLLDFLTPPLTPECPDSLPAKVPDIQPQEVKDAYAELYALYSEGMLFSQDEDYILPYGDMPLKAMCLHAAHDCNMRCGYCFAGKGDYCGERSLMSVETGKKALDFLLERSGKRHNLEVDFFGGEPLLNFEAVKEIVAYGRAREKELNKNIRFTLTTNGVLIDKDVIDFINSEISNIVLSIDGRREVHDAMRTFIDGSGTYDTILPKYKKLVEGRNGREYYVRGTFTAKNLDFASDVMHLADQGFGEISVEPVVLKDSEEYALKKEHLPQIFAQYELLARQLLEREKQGRGVDFFHFMVDLEAGPCAYKRTKGCGSGSEYVAVTPNGDIYPCHQFAGDESFRMGNVHEGTLDQSVRSRFAGHNITTMEECKKCWAKYYCGGGCAANNQKFNGALDIPYSLACEMERERVECALAIKASLATE